MEENKEIQTPVTQEPQKPQEAKKEKKQKAPKKPFNFNKVKRGGVATLMTVLFVAIVVALNVVVSALTDRFPSMNIDLTAQGLNTLSEQALEIARGVENETNIYLIGAEENYRENTIYSNYGLEYSQVANLAERLHDMGVRIIGTDLAERMQEANSKIHVEFIDPDTDPQFISDRAEDYLTTGKVLVETEKRSKVLSVNDLFSLQQDETTYQTVGYSMVDSALAGALEMVNMDEVPVLTIATGHDEILSSSNLTAFETLLGSQNFDVQEVDFMLEEIPAETQILLIPAPTSDYTDEEIQRLRDFLEDEETAKDLTVMVTCYPSQGELPKLAGFLEEWGVQVEPGIVAETSSSRVVVAQSSYVLVDAAEDILAEDGYSRLVSPVSSPLTLLFESNDGISTRALWSTRDTAYVITEDTTEAEAADPVTSQQIVATQSYRTVDVGEESYTRNVVVFGSSYVFTDTFLNASAFDDRQYVTDLLQYVTATDGSSITVETQAVQTQTFDVGASQSTIMLLGLGVFTIAIPVIILAVGLVIFLRRRHM